MRAARVFRVGAALMLTGLTTVVPVVVAHAAVASPPSTVGHETVAGAALPATASHPAAAGGTSPVQIVNFDYVPKSIAVAVGTTVTWTNTANRPHTVTDRGGTFDSQPILPGHTASVTFTAPGTYFYFCRINPSKMNGVVVIQPGTTPSKVDRVQQVDPANIVGESFRFDPNNLTVPAGTTLLVANVGGKPHTLTADDGSFSSGIVTPGAAGGRFAGTNAVLTLNTPGIYGFHCEIHPTLMKGTITVTGDAVSQPPPPSSNASQQGAIAAVDFAFNPTQLTVAPGAKLTVANKGHAQHSVTFDDVPVDSDIVQPGSSAPLTAPLQPGSYSYHCKVHPATMRGVLVVLGQNTPDPAPQNKTPSKPVLAVAGRGPGARVATAVLVTGVLGAFLAGLGIAPFVLRRRPVSDDSTGRPATQST